MITVIGFDGSPLSAEAAKALSSATLVLGGSRHLAGVELPVGVPTIVLGDVAAAIDTVSNHPGDVVVLASGDPGFFGIVRLLRERITADLRVLPAVSAVAAACARLGLAWDDAVVVSAHGRDPRRAVNACRRFDKVVVLTAPGAGPAELAAALHDLDDVQLVVCERLGEADERVVTVSLAEAAQSSWREPNVVIALREPAETAGAARTFAGPVVAADSGLPDDAFACQAGRITKAEIRAWVVARLAPAVGDLIWDLGAGSGSVGIECARRGSAVVLVERSVAACADIEANLISHGVRARLVRADAAVAAAKLPEPDAVFVGGGGIDVLDAALQRRPRRVVVTLASLDRIAGCREAMAAAGYDVDGTVIAASRLAPLPDGTTRLAALNPVVVLSGILA